MIRNLLYLFFLVAMLGAAICLLVVPASRRQLITEVGEGWERLYNAAANEEDIFKLPPPPPKTPAVKVVEGTHVVPRMVLEAPEEPQGILYSDKMPTASAPEKAEEKKAFVAPEKTSASKAAYNLLVEKSETVRKLVKNANSEYQFKEWRPVKSNPPEFWIELVASRRSDGQELHLTWSVHTERDEIRALSQAARDLERATEQPSNRGNERE